MKDQTQGIIVGASNQQEWLLPLWWMNYALYNAYPVTFVDFGDMSPKALEWCKHRGNVIKLKTPENFVAEKDAVDSETAKLWEAMHVRIWEVRREWFKKPFALQDTPYDKTIWIDLDCQIKSSLAPLFSLDLGEAGLTMAPEAEWQQQLNLSRKMIRPGEIVLNSGVLVYDKNSPIINDLPKEALAKNHLFFGDQQLLVHLLFSKDLHFTPMNPLYNWTVENGINPSALILHWSGRFKEQLRQQIQIIKTLLHIDLTF